MLEQFLEEIKLFLQPKFVEQNYPRTGRPKIGLTWAIIAVCVFAQSHNIVWHELPGQLANCQFLLAKGYFKKIPSTPTFHRYWKQMTEADIQHCVLHFGVNSSLKTDFDLAIDSSGFESRVGSMWRLAKWGKGALQKSSEIFTKVHIAVALPSRAIVSIVLTKSKVHDTPAFARVWTTLPQTVIPRLKRVHLDKGYWCENIIEFLQQESIQAVIPCKSNSLDHGSSGARDKLVRMQRKHPGLYKINCKPELRAEVEHVFGQIKLFHPILRARKQENKQKALLCQFLWYNYETSLRTVKVV